MKGKKQMGYGAAPKKTGGAKGGSKGGGKKKGC